MLRTTQSFGAFLTPSLRNVALTAPYMHDGRFNTLKEVVDFYDRGGDRHIVEYDALNPLNLSDQEKRDLAAFLEALTSSLPPIERPTLPPDSAQPAAPVSALDSRQPTPLSPRSDRPEPAAPAAPPAAAGRRRGERCSLATLTRDFRGVGSGSYGAGRLTPEDIDDVVRAYVYRALAGKGDEACAPLSGIVTDSSGIQQSADYMCRDWHHELTLVRAGGALRGAALRAWCLKNLAWSYRDFGPDDVRTVCGAISEDIDRPAALCARLAPRYLDPRLTPVCEREFGLLGGSSDASCPKAEDPRHSFAERRCGELRLYHEARAAGDAAVCGDHGLCRSLMGGALSEARRIESDVCARVRD